jgi:polysaccharide deacetylase family protein (PEP-CTERM system associated)
MMTVDVEDYFQVEAFANRINRADWSRYDCRVERNTNRILELFAGGGAKATFFTLGWIAERYPSLIRRIAAEGHEIASHGMAHYRADAQGYDRLLVDLKDSRALLEDIAGQRVNGYRAASFSVTRKNLWALDAIAEAGYRYSSSIYPVHHDLYGIPDAPRRAFRPFETSDFLEIPVTAFPVSKRLNLPAGGGGYFRLLPYWWSHFQLRRVAQSEPCMFYFHPWEIDPEQPPIAGISLKTRVRHYTNLKRMQDRLQQVLRDFAWTRVDAVYPLS